MSGSRQRRPALPRRPHGLIGPASVLRAINHREDRHGRHIAQTPDAAALAGDVGFAARLAAAPRLLGGRPLDRTDQRAVCDPGRPGAGAVPRRDRP
ncbi:hypothetical protein MPLB_210017 [Mesorhizobium sp. ORS 3324]|nr:hypothetical protein MPLB_210017 [Mesorhizobium sp. ORS 3324]